MKEGLYNIFFSFVLSTSRLMLLQGDEVEAAHASRYQNVNEKHPSMVKASVTSISLANQKSKKKKKKKSKADLSSNVEDHERSCNVTLENLSLEVDSSSQQRIASYSRKAKSANISGKDSIVKQLKPSILQVDPKFLSAENELRRIFGSKVVNSFEKGHQAGNSRQSLTGRRGSYSHRRTILVSPSEHWPRWDGSLSMELLESSNGVNYFR